VVAARVDDLHPAGRPRRAQPVGGVTFRQDEIGSGRVAKRAEMSQVDGVRAVTGG
jgi:hypothetical protein